MKPLACLAISLLLWGLVDDVWAAALPATAPVAEADDDYVPAEGRSAEEARVPVGRRVGVGPAGCRAVSPGRRAVAPGVRLLAPPSGRSPRYVLMSLPI